MPPKITNTLAWSQAELLMQPAFLRVIDNLGQQLDSCSWTHSYEEIETPYPGYLLRLKKDTQEVVLNIWELCYQICFLNYQTPHTELQSYEVEIDSSLLDNDTGDVDWDRLEEKTKAIIDDIFAHLPS